MKSIISAVQRFARDEEGATTIEYALIAVLITVAAVTAIGNVGDAVSDTFTSVYNSLTGAAS